MPFQPYNVTAGRLSSARLQLDGAAGSVSYSLQSRRVDGGALQPWCAIREPPLIQVDPFLGPRTARFGRRHDCVGGRRNQPVANLFIFEPGWARGAKILPKIHFE